MLLSLRPLLKKTRHTVSLECGDDIVLRSYPGAFSQILTNLITNSITHAFAKGESGILRMEFTMNDITLNFVYSDNGKGIAAADLPHIFEPFFTTSRNKGGSGLGLHIIYNIITQKLNGSVTCHSAPGAGTTFTIQLPAR